MLSVHTVHDLRLRAPASRFCPPNTPQSRQFVGLRTRAYYRSKFEDEPVKASSRLFDQLFLER